MKSLLSDFHRWFRSRRDWCIFAHHDRDNMVDEYAFRLIDGVRAAGYRVVFVSAAESLREEDTQRLRRCCEAIRMKPNRGLDFAAWKLGLDLVPPLETLDSLLLMNDSVFGPFRPLAPMFRRMRRKQLDFWGITDSHEQGWHLQSYFLVFGRRVLRSQLFREFWYKSFAEMTKAQIIQQGEIALSKALVDAGFKGAALCPVETVAAWHARQGRWRSPPNLEVNPSLLYWDLLVTKYRCPFMKKEALRDNPVRTPHLGHWDRVVSGRRHYDPDVIDRYLTRMVGPDWLDRALAGAFEPETQGKPERV